LALGAVRFTILVNVHHYFGALTVAAKVPKTKIGVAKRAGPAVNVGKPLRFAGRS
jgi:hypothetical protein